MMVFDSCDEAAVLSAAAAPVSLEQAQHLLAEHYEVQGTLKPLSGERDANFLLTCEKTGSLFLFKISHPIEPQTVTNFQTVALRFLEETAPQIPVQRIIASRSGQYEVVAELMPHHEKQNSNAPKTKRVIRLLRFLHGTPMRQAPQSAQQAQSVAQQLAVLDKALSKLPRHAAADFQLPWDIQRADSVEDLCALIENREKSALVQHALWRFKTFVQPHLATLRTQAIHNDFNMSNLLVHPDRPEQVCGILDFGDMVWAPLINDVAVAASYQMDTSSASAALQSIADFAAAYHAIYPLTAAEQALLLDLIQARLSMVVCISQWRAKRQPANADYIMRNNQASWQRLQICHAIDRDAALQTITQVCPLCGEPAPV